MTNLCAYVCVFVDLLWQMKYYKLAKREYCEIFPCKEERRFVVVLFVIDDYLSSSLHVVDIFIRSQDFTSGDENILQIQTRFSYHAPIHIQCKFVSLLRIPLNT